MTDRKIAIASNDDDDDLVLPLTTTQMSGLVVFAFCFNIIVGTGALALPRLFLDAGLITGTLFLVIVCGFSFVCATWMFESMVNCNAIMRLRALKAASSSASPPLSSSASLSTTALSSSDSSSSSSLSTLATAPVTRDADALFAVAEKTDGGAIALLVLPPWLKVSW
jgi:hypothetical protein